MFLIYVLFLILSGILMLVMGGIRAAYAKRRRVLNLVLGVGFLGYGLYLLLFFQGGHYVMFYYAFILPILLIVQFFRDRSAYKEMQRQQAARAAYGQPKQAAASAAVAEPAAPVAPEPAQGQARPAYDQPGYGLPRDPGQPAPQE